MTDESRRIESIKICSECGATKTNHWYTDGKGGHLCKRHYRRQKRELYESTAERVLCACGRCNEWIPKLNDRGELARFKHGHNSLGNKHGWKGGRTISSSGYVLIKMPEHHRANSSGYVFEHVLVYEEFYKCCLLSWTEIHHINKIRTDNRPENLKATDKSNHGKIHNPLIDMSNRVCVDCGHGVDLVGRVWRHDKHDYAVLRCTRCHDILLRCYQDLWSRTGLYH